MAEPNIEDEFEALLARGEAAAAPAVPAGEPVQNQLPGGKPAAAPEPLDLDKVKRALTSEFDQSTVNRAFQPLLNVIENQAKLVTGFRQELARRDSEAYEARIIELAQKTGDTRYGTPGAPLTKEQYEQVTTLHRAAMGAMKDSVEAAKQDPSKQPMTPDQAIERAQQARMGKSEAVRAVQASAQARHQSRTFTPQSAAPSGGGSVSHRQEGIAAIEALTRAR